MNLDSSLSVKYETTKEDCDFIKWNLIGYNIETVGPKLNIAPFEYNVIIRNKNNEIVAGILTAIFLKSMYVECLWVNSKLRKQRIGSELLESSEKYAKENGCTFIHLDTFSFQAIEFYKKKGYFVFATIDGYPENIKRYYVKKFL